MYISKVIITAFICLLLKNIILNKINSCEYAPHNSRINYWMIHLLNTNCYQDGMPYVFDKSNRHLDGYPAMIWTLDTDLTASGITVF